MESMFGNQTNPQMGQAGQPSAPGRYPKWAYALAAVVILAIVAWLYVMYADKQGAGNENRVDAPRGQVVAGFPKELLLDEDAAIEASYALEYKDDGSELPVAQYVSKLPMPQIVTMYSNYLLAADWSVSRFGDPDEYPSTYFNAAKDTAEVTIIITEGDEGTIVRVAYLSR